MLSVEFCVLLGFYPHSILFALRAFLYDTIILHIVVLLASL